MTKPKLLLIGLLCWSPWLLAQWQVNAYLTSDYIYRGESLSAGQPALQAEGIYTHPHYFAGIWHSTVRRAGSASDQGHSGSELALFGCLTWSLAQRINLSLAWFGYAYPDDVFDPTDEGYLGLDAHGLALKLWRNQQLDFTYSEAALQPRLGDKLEGLLHLGHKHWDNAPPGVPASATDWSAGIRLKLSELSLALALSDLDHTPGSRQVTLTLSKSFAL